MFLSPYLFFILNPTINKERDESSIAGVDAKGIDTSTTADGEPIMSTI